MLLLDERIGSRHYKSYLGDRAAIAHLDSGDACFEGNGVTVGIEIKKLLDAVSCLYSGRLADRQIPLMKEQYDVCYLIIEGSFRPSPEGILQYWKPFPSKTDRECGVWRDASAGTKRLMFSAFESWLSTMENLGGVRVRQSASPETTASLLMSLHSWWNREDHSSFKVMHGIRDGGAVLSRPKRQRRVLAELPHIGWERSELLMKRFPTMRQAVDARIEDWFIEGQIAEKSALDIVRFLNGDE